MAGRIPQEFLDQLLGRADLFEIINARVPLRRAGREFTACCPFHNEKTPSFSVSPHKQFYYCFGCGAHGNAIDFMMTYEHLEFLEAVEELAVLTGLDVPLVNFVDNRLHMQSLLKWTIKAEIFYRQQLREHPFRQRAISYLRQRGLSGQIAKTFSIGYAPPGESNLSEMLYESGASIEELSTAGLISQDSQGRTRDRFRNRIIFPIRDRRGQTIGFGGRALDSDTTPKYLNSPETLIFHKGSTLYGFYEARIYSRPQLKQLLIVEGYMDVVALAQCGIHYAVATLGTATTHAQVEQLFRTVNEITFCFDGDQAGRNAAWRALEIVLPFIREGRQVSFLLMPEGEDPDTIVRSEGRIEFEKRLVQAVPLAEYIFDRLRTRTDSNTLAGRARFAELVQPLLEKLPDGHFRDLMVDRLRKETYLFNTRLRLPPQVNLSTPPHDQVINLTSTPLRKAIALLLYRPDLAQHITSTDLGILQNKDVSEQGLKLLVNLIVTLHSNPQLNMTSLIERYRNTNEGTILEKLATWSPEIQEEQDYLFEQEFKDIISSIKRRGSLRERLPEMLIRRGTPRALSPEEREALRNLGKIK